MISNGVGGPHIHTYEHNSQRFPNKLNLICLYPIINNSMAHDQVQSQYFSCFIQISLQTVKIWRGKKGLITHRKKFNLWGKSSFFPSCSGLPPLRFRELGNNYSILNLHYKGIPSAIACNCDRNSSLIRHILWNQRGKKTFFSSSPPSAVRSCHGFPKKDLNSICLQHCKWQQQIIGGFLHIYTHTEKTGTQSNSNI